MNKYYRATELQIVVKINLYKFNLFTWISIIELLNYKFICMNKYYRATELQIVVKINYR
jgi:hypothetical protein